MQSSPDRVTLESASDEEANLPNIPWLEALLTTFVA